MISAHGGKFPGGQTSGNKIPSENHDVCESFGKKKVLELKKYGPEVYICAGYKKWGGIKGISIPAHGGEKSGKLRIIYM